MACLRCSGERIVVGELDSSSAIMLRMVADRDRQRSGPFTDTAVQLLFDICLDCGHAELHVANLRALKETVERSGIGLKDQPAPVHRPGGGSTVME